MTSEVLFLSHRIPFPPDRGDKIRSHHILRRIAELAPVHVATFADDDRDLASESELEHVARSHCLVRRSKPLPVAGIEALASGKPVSLTAFHDSRLSAYIERVLRERPIGAIYVFSGQMGQYVPTKFAGRMICDFVDVDSAKFEAYAERARGPGRWLNKREERLLRAEEQRLAVGARTSLLISAEEAALFRARLTPEGLASSRVEILRNGIDSQFFDSTSVVPEPRLVELPGPRLIFTGQMDYPPNVDAALRAIERLLPAIRKEFPQASLHIVGRGPTAPLLAHNGRNGCYVWGEVEDIRTWLAGANLALVPLEIARGVQNKVLEAMAMTLPVVLTPAAATGIGASDGHHFATASEDAELIQRAVTLLSDAPKATELGQSARRFVVSNLSWPAVLRPLEDLLGGEGVRNRHAA